MTASPTARVWPAATLAAAALSGAPSTVHALVTGRDPLESLRAAGTLLLSDDADPGPLAVAGVAAHVVVSTGWALLLWPMVRGRVRPVVVGAAAGAVIAATDLGLARRFFPRIAALPTAPQVADHVAFGAIVGAVAGRAHPAAGPA